GSWLHKEEEDDSYFHKKRLCIKTSIGDNIFESFKIIVKEDVNDDALSEFSKEDSHSEADIIPEIVFEEGEVKSSDIKEKSNEDEPMYPPSFTSCDNSATIDSSFCGAKIHQMESSKKENGFKTCFKEDVNASVCSGHFKKVGSPKSGGFILQLIEDLTKVGQTMGYKMKGCINDMGEIVKSQGDNEFFK
nr:RNA-directed DNA polymerase, eukaryota, reverse transcriptase zinc-binding domain protein [Tanacetum cinerariifolium]